MEMAKQFQVYHSESLSFCEKKFNCFTKRNPTFPKQSKKISKYGNPKAIKPINVSTPTLNCCQILKPKPPARRVVASAIIFFLAISIQRMTALI